MRRALSATARGTAGLAAGLAVLGALTYAVLLVAGFRPVVVYSGSMEPTVPVGSLVFTRNVPSSEVRVGDVVTFQDPYEPGRLVTHRIVQVIDRPAGLAYRTKGDANPSRDPWAIALPPTAARTAFHMPVAGYALWYAKTREVRTLLIAAVAAALLVSVLRRIWGKSELDAPEVRGD